MTRGHVTSTAYRTPHRPRALRFANHALRVPAGVLKVGPFSLAPEALMRAAEQRTGLRDFGDRSFEAPLARLVTAIESEARLHPVGRLITRERLIGTLATRLWLEADHARSTSAASASLERPIVIVGLPRTGTTLLHRMLASDRRLRALASWEALAPAPLEGPDERQRRIDAARRAEAGLRWMAPDFFAVHPIDAHAPEEDVLLLDLAFRSTVAESTLRVPSFSRWLEGQDQRPAYRYLRRTLQALSRQRGGDARWVLKTPHHLEWLDALLEEFPGATIVWTHRDPQHVVPSFCSMLAHGRGVFSDAVDPHEIGRDWLRKGARMMSRAMQTRDRVGEGAFVDVHYDALLADPIGTARRILERAGSTLTRDAETSMRDRLRVSVQHRHGVHRYALTDFGLRASDVDDAFADYRARFGT